LPDPPRPTTAGRPDPVEIRMTTPTGNPARLPVAVIVGATSKWQPDGRNTMFVHGTTIGDDMPPETRWGLGGALAQRFAREGHHVVLTTRRRANAEGLATALEASGGSCSVVELDVGVAQSVSATFASIREDVGDPDVLIYNAGYMAGRELPEDQELLEHFPTELFEVALATACRGPFLVAKEVLPAMRRRGRGSILFSNNQYSLRGRKRSTGESLYYPRTMMRAFAQALTEEYSAHGVHVANVVVDGFIDSPGTRALPRFQEQPELLIDPSRIAEAFHYLHQQDRSCWTHELQVTAAAGRVSV
jgi:NAD(P)-dependent dehydrogenase (short-subunit alcohol dehydrogenase family)